ncbi:hypothetical protein SAMN05216481_104329 [Streptomyces radiopugnans]|uniref:Uncharacterized protein n=1 Tax=Streptomyces radiopugnans TaxID=403935 RepID=A0A1H9DWU9_9ACTN|nr:hypothetical protein SAMN05216481_104329 [Streptomyces radiopugnans]
MPERSFIFGYRHLCRALRRTIAPWGSPGCPVTGRPESAEVPVSVPDFFFPFRADRAFRADPPPAGAPGAYRAVPPRPSRSRRPLR